MAHHAAVWQDLHDTLVASLPHGSFLEAEGTKGSHAAICGDLVLQQVLSSHLWGTFHSSPTSGECYTRPYEIRTQVFSTCLDLI